MGESLDISERLGAYYVQWVIDGELGGVVGEERFDESDLVGASGELWDVIKANLTASKTDGVQRDSTGYYWDSPRLARSALRAIRAALRDKTSKPWPDWAIAASAAGWKAPKGWKP